MLRHIAKCAKRCTTIPECRLIVTIFYTEVSDACSEYLRKGTKSDVNILGWTIPEIEQSLEGYTKKEIVDMIYYMLSRTINYRFASMFTKGGMIRDSQVLGELIARLNKGCTSECSSLRRASQAAMTDVLRHAYLYVPTRALMFNRVGVIDVDGHRCIASYVDPFKAYSAANKTVAMMPIRGLTAEQLAEAMKLDGVCVQIAENRSVLLLPHTKQEDIAD